MKWLDSMPTRARLFKSLRSLRPLNPDVDSPGMTDACTAQQDHLDEDVLAEHHGHLGWTPLGWPSRASSSKSSQPTGDGPSRSAPFAQHTVSNYSGIGLPGGIQVRILLPALLIERSGRSGFRHFKPYSSVTAYLQPT